MGLFSRKTEVEKIINEYGKEFADELFCTVYTHSIYSEKLGCNVDHRKWMHWTNYIKIYEGMDLDKMRYQGKYYEAVNKHISNKKLIDELSVDPKLYTKNSLIAGFEKYYATIDFSKERNEKGLVNIDSFINTYGEGKGHAFLVLYITSYTFYSKVVGQVDRRQFERIVKYWEEYSLKYLYLEYGKQGVDEYLSVTQSEEFKLMKDKYIQEASKSMGEYVNPIMLLPAPNDIVRKLGIVVKLS